MATAQLMELLWAAVYLSVVSWIVAIIIAQANHAIHQISYYWDEHDGK